MAARIVQTVTSAAIILAIVIPLGNRDLRYESHTSRERERERHQKRVGSGKDKKD
jgi:hypothetical protein